jgi:hypothetical protein
MVIGHFSKSFHFSPKYAKKSDNVTLAQHVIDMGDRISNLIQLAFIHTCSLF